MIKLYISHNNNQVDIRNYRKGFEKNADVKLVNDLNDADFLVCFSFIKNLENAIKLKPKLVKKIDESTKLEFEKIKNFPANKTIYIDYVDDVTTNLCCSNYEFLNCFLYFKRNCVDRKNNISYNLHRYERDVIPVSFYVSDNVLDYIEKNNNFTRTYDISCLFDKHQRGLRREICNFLMNNNKLKEKYKIHVGVIKAKKNKYNSLNNAYFNHLLQSKIIVTSTPKNHEGDYRTYEALASGALVMVDYNIVPIMYPFIHKKHIIYYKNMKELEDYINYYLEHPEERNKIAQCGYEYAIKHHNYRQKALFIIDTIKQKVMQT